VAFVYAERGLADGVLVDVNLALAQFADGIRCSPT
jgi:hypothetical protein